MKKALPGPSRLSHRYHVSAVNTHKGFCCLLGPGLRQSSNLRGFEVYEQGGCGAGKLPQTVRERGLLALISRGGSSFRTRPLTLSQPAAPPTPFSGSTFSFLESTNLPCSGPLLPPPPRIWVQEVPGLLSPIQGWQIRIAPLYLPRSKPHISRAEKFHLWEASCRSAHRAHTQNNPKTQTRVQGDLAQPGRGCKGLETTCVPRARAVARGITEHPHRHPGFSVPTGRRRAG